MTRITATALHGRRTIPLGQISGELAVAAAAGRGLNPTHKWRLFNKLSTAKDAYGLTDRTLTVLRALLSFHPAEDLPAGQPIIVYPSNIALSDRANGIPYSTLRRHLGRLVDAAIVIRRDSPNGKRYSKKGGEAFGFDLAPLIARAAEFDAAAIAILQERSDRRALREIITLARREITASLTTAAAEQIPGEWEEIAARYKDLTAGAAPKALSDLDNIATQLASLAQRAKALIESYVGRTISTPAEIDPRNDNNSIEPGERPTIQLGLYESQTERHKEQVLSDQVFKDKESGKGRTAVATIDASSGAKRESEGHHPLDLSLNSILAACPDILAYAPSAIRNFDDFSALAENVARWLQVMPATWREANMVFGRQTAAILIAAITQRASEINSPGAYLNFLIKRKRAGRFSLGKIITALHNRALKRPIGD